MRVNGCGRAFAVALIVTAGAWAAEEDAKPHIVILATGGTIAGSAATGTEAGYRSGQLGVDVLIGAVPQLAELAVVTGEQVANIGSQDMTDAIWLELARRVNQLAKRTDVDGIVITHGTDTIEETGYFLNLVAKTDKPVVMTAAMRPSTSLSADGPLNIFDAVAVAADPEARGRGVLIVVNDDIGTVASGELNPAKSRVLLKLVLLRPLLRQGPASGSRCAPPLPAAPSTPTSSPRALPGSRTAPAPPGTGALTRQVSRERCREIWHTRPERSHGSSRSRLRSAPG
jgi:L-asparaginase/Glu-tRNA(Gln) amidotransferase subunit D